MRMVMVAAGLASVALGGCASLQMNPEYGGLPEVGMPATTEKGAQPPTRLRTLSALKAPGKTTGGQRIGYELQRVALSANNYLAAGKALAEEDRGAGALVLGSGFYGAAVTAFNPAPKNLLAALLAGGTGQAWRSSLKPAERARIYVQGYRALDCAYSAGSVLAEEADLAQAPRLRAEIGLWIDQAEQVRRNAPADTPAADLAALADLLTKARELDAALALEQNALIDGPYRVARVRREIEAAVDKRLAASAPDYAAALKLISEAAKPASTPEAPPPEAGLVAQLPDTVAEMLRDLPAKLAAWKTKAPTRAADAYERMGKCIELVG